MRWALTIALILILVGCRTLVDKVPEQLRLPINHNKAISLEEYLANQRELNERYLYGSPHEALKALESLATLEEDYAKEGQRPIDSNHARMLSYSRLFVLSERLRQRPEAEMYLEKALHFAVMWKPELSSRPMEGRVDFVRHYVDEFERGLTVRWKNELQ